MYAEFKEKPQELYDIYDIERKFIPFPNSQQGIQKLIEEEQFYNDKIVYLQGLEVTILNELVDEEFNISFKGAGLIRNVEYCSWREIKKEKNIKKEETQQNLESASQNKYNKIENDKNIIFIYDLIWQKNMLESQTFQDPKHQFNSKTVIIEEKSQHSIFQLGERSQQHPEKSIKIDSQYLKSQDYRLINLNQNQLKKTDFSKKFGFEFYDGTYFYSFQIRQNSTQQNENLSAIPISTENHNSEKKIDLQEYYTFINNSETKKINNDKTNQCQQAGDIRVSFEVSDIYEYVSLIGQYKNQQIVPVNGLVLNLPGCKNSSEILTSYKQKGEFLALAARALLFLTLAIWMFKMYRKETLKYMDKIKED